MRQQSTPGRRGASRACGCPAASSRVRRQREPLVDMPADQELRRGQPLQLEGLGGRGRVGRVEVGLSRLGAPTGVGQRIAQLPPQGDACSAGPACSSSRGPIQPRGVVEGQRRGRLVGPAGVVLARRREVARAAIVAGQDLRVDRAGRRQDRRQPLVVPSQAVRRQVADHRLADPVVVDLDLVLVAGPGLADQPRGPERRQCHATAGPQLGGLEGQRLADRTARDRDDAQQPLRVLRLALDPLPEHLVQVELADRLPAVDRLAPLDVPDQLVDEQRIAARLAGHHVRLGPRHGIVAVQQGQRQLAGLRLGQRLDRQLAMIQRRGPARRSTAAARPGTGSPRRPPSGSCPRRAGPAIAASRAGPRAGSRCPRRPTAGRRSPGPAAPSPPAAGASRAARRRPGAGAPAGRAARAPRDAPRPARRHALEHGEQPRQVRRVRRQQRREPSAPAGPSGTGPGRRSGCRGPCTGPTRARSSAPASTIASSRAASPSRNDRMSVVLPVPVRPKTKTDCVRRRNRPVKAESRTWRCRARPIRGNGRPGSGASARLGRRPVSRAMISRPARPPGRVAVEQLHAEPDQVLRAARRPASTGDGGVRSAWRRSAPAAARRTAAGRSAPRRASRRRCTSRSPG